MWAVLERRPPTSTQSRQRRGARRAASAASLLCAALAAQAETLEDAWRAALADLILREHPGKRRTLRAGADAAGTLVPSTAAGHVIMRTS